MTINQLSKLTLLSTQYLYKVVKTPIKGEIYNEENTNYEELKKVLLRTYNNDVEKLLNVLNLKDLNDLVIERNTKSSIINTNEVKLDDLEISKDYLLKSYHYEMKVHLVNVIENDEDILYIFLNLNESKVKNDKYRILTLEELSDKRFKIYNVEE